MSALSRPNAKAAFALLALAAALRFWKIDLPFVEPYNSLSRQAIVASVARNFYERGFNFFYPEIDENGRGPYLYNAEMPVYSYLMALMYALAGGVKEWAARSVSVCFSLGTILLLYFWIRRTDGALAAIAAATFAALSPLYLAISRSVQPDATMLFASLASLYGLFLYVEDKKSIALFLSALSMWLALATRIQMLPYLVVPWLVIAWRRDRQRLFIKPAYIFYWLGVSTVLLWYVAMWRAGREQTLIYNPYDYLNNRGPEGVSFWASFAPLYWWKLGRVAVLHLLSPLGAFLVIVGLLTKDEKGRPPHGLWVGWLGGSALYAAIFWRFMIDHSYYQIPFIPPAAYFIGRGTAWIFPRLRRRFFLAVGVAILTVSSFAGALYLYRGIYWVPDSMKHIVEAGHAADDLLPKDALVAAHYGTSTIQLYYSHRRGWAFSVHGGSDEKKLIKELERLRIEGAGYFVTSLPDDLKRFPGFDEYLRSRYALIRESPGYALFDLTGETPIDI